MYTGLKGVQGGDKVGKTLTQARIQTGKDETWGRGKQTNKKNHNIKELGEKTSQFTGGKQGKTIIKIDRKWSEDRGYRDKTEVDKVKKTLQTAGKCEHMKI